MFLPEDYKPHNTSCHSVFSRSRVDPGTLGSSNRNNSRYIIGFSVAVFGTLLLAGGYWLYKRRYLHRVMDRTKPRNRSRWPKRNIARTRKGQGVTLRAPERTYQRGGEKGPVS